MPDLFERAAAVSSESIVACGAGKLVRAVNGVWQSVPLPAGTARDVRAWNGRLFVLTVNDRVTPPSVEVLEISAAGSLTSRIQSTAPADDLPTLFAVLGEARAATTGPKGRIRWLGGAARPAVSLGHPAEKLVVIAGKPDALFAQITPSQGAIVKPNGQVELRTLPAGMVFATGEAGQIGAVGTHRTWVGDALEPTLQTMPATQPSFISFAGMQQMDPEFEPRTAAWLGPDTPFATSDAGWFAWRSDRATTTCAAFPGEMVSIKTPQPPGFESVLRPEATPAPAAVLAVDGGMLLDARGKLRVFAPRELGATLLTATRVDREEVLFVTPLSPDTCLLGTTQGVVRVGPTGESAVAVDADGREVLRTSGRSDFGFHQPMQVVRAAPDVTWVANRTMALRVEGNAATGSHGSAGTFGAITADPVGTFRLADGVLTQRWNDPAAGLLVGGATTVPTPSCEVVTYTGSVRAPVAVCTDSVLEWDGAAWTARATLVAGRPAQAAGWLPPNHLMVGLAGGSVVAVDL